MFPGLINWSPCILMPSIFGFEVLELPPEPADFFVACRTCPIGANSGPDLSSALTARSHIILQEGQD
eukprot:1886606-Pleurochrysis_carterae.AAC.8